MKEAGVSVVEQDILHYFDYRMIEQGLNNRISASIQLDTETGKVTNYKHSYESKISPEQEEKLKNPSRVSRLDRHSESITAF